MRIQAGLSKVSLADLIVLGGSAAIEQAAKEGGFTVKVPFHAGRGDASQEMTDVESFEVLEPTNDAFRNFMKAKYVVEPEELMLDKAQCGINCFQRIVTLIGECMFYKELILAEQNTGVFPG